MRRKAIFFITTMFVFAVLTGLAATLASNLFQTQVNTGVTVRVNRDTVNVRLVPAIGAEVIGFANEGFTATATGRSGDGEWVRIDFSGEEGWIGFPVIDITGDFNSLPVADPRSIPYGGFEAPLAGQSNATSPVSGRLADSGLRIRSGPGRGYVILANAPRFTVFPVTGRTENNSWFQVNYEGTLGWVSARWVTLQDGASVLDVPIGGVVASAPPIGADDSDYENTLRLFLARLDLAQPSIDELRSIYAGAALGQRPQCFDFPARPSNFNVPNPLLAANYQVLDPLQRDFNEAMANVRLALDILIDACQQPGPVVTSQPVVLAGLQAVETADEQFEELRRRLFQLLPPEREIGPNDCVFQYIGQTEILPVIFFNELFRDFFDDGRVAGGYCVDITGGTYVRIEVLVADGNFDPVVSISPLNNPTNFLGVGRSDGEGITLVLGPVLIPETGRYLIILNDENFGVREDPLFGEVVTYVTAAVDENDLGPALMLDAVTGEVTVGGTVAVTDDPLDDTLEEEPPANVNNSFLNQENPNVVCPGITLTCSQLLTCDEAIACYNAGNTGLDGDGDTVPCGNLCDSRLDGTDLEEDDDDDDPIEEDDDGCEETPDDDDDNLCDELA